MKKSTPKLPTHTGKNNMPSSSKMAMPKGKKMNMKSKKGC